MALDAAYLKSRFLQGICLEDTTGAPYPDSHLDQAIAESKKYFERRYGVLLQTSLVQVGNVATKDLPTPLPGPLIRRDGIDYDPAAWHDDRWSAIQLPLGPIQQIHFVALGLGGEALPEIITFPIDWWQLSTRRYWLRLYPGYLSLAQYRLTAFHLGIIANKRRIPNSFRVAYTAGFNGDTDLETNEPDLYHALGARAVITVLPNLAMLQEGDVTSESVSVDGLSTSRSYTTSGQTHRLSPLQSALEQQVKEFESTYFDTQRGPRVFHL